jgi:hypothetical protein
VEADAHSGVSSATESALSLPPYPYVFCQPHGVFGTHLRTVEPLGLRQRWVALLQKLSGPTQQISVALSTKYPPAEAGPRLQHGKSLVSPLTRHESPHDFPAGQHSPNSGSAHSSPGGQQAFPHWVDPCAHGSMHAQANGPVGTNGGAHCWTQCPPQEVVPLGHWDTHPQSGPRTSPDGHAATQLPPQYTVPLGQTQAQSCSTMPPLHGYTHSTSPLDVVQQLPPTQQLPF